MGCFVGHLNAMMVKKLTKVGRHSDGNNLYLQITKSGSKSWIFRYMMNGKAREMGLGSLDILSLAEAREKAADARKLLNAGSDPILAKRIQETKIADSHSFQECAQKYIDTYSSTWKNPKHRNQWKNTLTTYAYPVIGEINVKDVELHHIKTILEPIWHNKNETASRLRGRIERILDWAKVSGLREGENPARWRGHLENLFPKPSKVQTIQHFEALPYQKLPVFFKELLFRSDVSALALKLLILTATRTNEIIAARWDEFDLKKALWTIPALRMKMGKEHRIPLCKSAIELLKKLAEMKDSEYVFTSVRGKHLSNMAMLQLLKRWPEEKYKNYTVHGFRSSFRDWTAETTDYSNEVCEMALAHVISNKAEAAYRRGDLLEKRKQLMYEWESFLLE